MQKMLLAAVGAIGAMALNFAAVNPASAALVLPASEAGCDLYSAQGCLFEYDNGEGNVFKDPAAFVSAYNAVHNATPAPEDLPTLTYLGDQSGNAVSKTFTNLPFLVSFYTVKSGSNEVILFGLATPTDSFTATNTRIKNGQSPNFGDISHVAFFGAEAGVVPEPGTWALMILGFGGAGAMLRYRRKIAFA